MYVGMRDDMNDSELGRTFLEKSDIVQVFIPPPRYTSLSKDKSKLKEKSEILEIISDVFSDVSNAFALNPL